MTHCWTEAFFILCKTKKKFKLASNQNIIFFSLYFLKLNSIREKSNHLPVMGNQLAVSEVKTVWPAFSTFPYGYYNLSTLKLPFTLLPITGSSLLGLK